MASKNNNSAITFSGLLCLIFIVLKLTKIIDWSWWWVLSPLWIPALCVILIIIFFSVKK